MVGVQHSRVVQLHNFKAVWNQNQTYCWSSSVIREACLSAQVACCLYAALNELLRLTVRVEWIGTRPVATASRGPLFSKPRSSTLKDTALGFLSISTYLPLSLFLPPPLTFPPSFPPSLDRSLSYFCAVSLTDCCLNIRSVSLPDLRAHQIINKSLQMAFIK